MKRVAVIGAGVMGLAAAYKLLKTGGYEVTVYEAGDSIGGMAVHFDFSGINIERYYHFICKPDTAMFDLVSELGLEASLKWKCTRMGYFMNGKLYDWGNPVALLKFPALSLIQKMRYGLHMFYCTKISDWHGLDKINARDWFKKWIGQSTYDILWDKLFALKFYKYENNLSAAWIWSRIKRVGVSRKNIMQEELGYLEGGSKTLLDALVQKIEDMGGTILTSTPVKSSATVDNKIMLETSKGKFGSDYVISTIPLPYVSRLFPQLPHEIRRKYDQIENMGVVCVIVKTRKQLTPNFWLNINDPEIEIPGLIEMSNLQNYPDTIIYAPFYLPVDNPKFTRTDEQFIQETIACLLRVNPDYTEDDILDITVSRYGRAQPVCPPGFENFLPDINTPVPGLVVADTTYYYPEDRSISESIKLGNQMADLVINAEA